MLFVFAIDVGGGVVVVVVAAIVEGTWQRHFQEIHIAQGASERRRGGVVLGGFEHNRHLKAACVEVGDVWEERLDLRRRVGEPLWGLVIEDEVVVIDSTTRHER